MINKQILDYVQSSLESKYSVEQISAALSGQGWGAIEINEALLKAQEIIQQKSIAQVAPPLPPKKNEWNIELKHLSASQILLFIGGLIVILAGIIYIGINWQQWGSVARVSAIFLPMLICYIVGSLMFFNNEHKKQGLAFIIVGSILFPFFLYILLKELGIFTQVFDDNFGLIISLSTFALYFLSSFVFRLPIWTFLYETVFLFVFYFILRVLGVEGIFQGSALAWLFLIPGTMYLLFGILYHLSGKEIEANYSYSLGTLVLVLFFLRLLTEMFNHDYLSWIFLLFGFIYFGLGTWLEIKGVKKYCSAPYFIGTGLIFLSLFHIGSSGMLLRGSIKDVGYDKYLSGWSNFIVGVIYLVIAWLISTLQRFQVKEGVLYKNFFNIIGPFFVLGAVLQLGLGGKEPFYETLLLLLSLAFIFGSIPTLSREFLYIGTLFLVIYIFSIGAEYFQNDVGWPITLFVAGLLSMGIGVAIEKVRRKYFVLIKQ